MMVTISCGIIRLKPSLLDKIYSIMLMALIYLQPPLLPIIIIRFAQIRLLSIHYLLLCQKPILASVVGCKTSASMWSLISKYFTHKSTANSSYLRRRLNEISRRTRSVLDYLQEAKSISDQQASIGEPISNIDLVNTVLRGLGDEYEMLVTTLDSLDTLPDLVLYDLIF
ncbi:unnamed protein product [Prunus armeniaca]|uniref:Uncharacterized protein n=1 Tax=Prunus armeniaca TaxID=36596 RepID=A0A6J5VX62_PRUAR|nr:unnamed protein product [Prunus armeniaca]